MYCVTSMVDKFLAHKIKTSKKLLIHYFLTENVFTKDVNILDTCVQKKKLRTVQRINNKIDSIHFGKMLSPSQLSMLYLESSTEYHKNERD